MLGNKARGFTLLEILVAVFILGIISVIMLRGLETAITTKHNLEKNSMRLQNLEFALTFLKSDIQSMVNQSIVTEDGTEINAVWLHPDAQQMLEFTRGGVANPLAAPRSTLIRVAYSINEGDLVRTTWSTLNRTATTETHQRVLLSGITKLEWLFLGPANSWSGAWPSASLAPGMNVPRAVQVSFDIRGWGSITRIFVVNAQNPSKALAP